MKYWCAFAHACAPPGRKKVTALRLLGYALGLAFPVNAQDRKGTIITFHAPGVWNDKSPDCAPGCGAVAFGNNDLGVIVGTYTDKNIVPHGFLRTPDGQITSFDAPLEPAWGMGSTKVPSPTPSPIWA